MAARVAKVHFATADSKAACGMTARVLETTAQLSLVTCKACQTWLAEREEATAAQADVVPVIEPEKEVSMSKIIHQVKAEGKSIAALCGTMGENDILTHYYGQVNCGVCKGIAANSTLTPARDDNETNNGKGESIMKQTPRTPAFRVEHLTTGVTLSNTQEPISIMRDVPAEPEVDSEIAALEAQIIAARAKKEAARIQAEKDAAEALAREKAQRKAEKSQHSTADVITLDVPLRSAEVSAKVSYLLALTQQGPVAIAEALNYHLVEVGAVLPPRRARVLEPGAGAVLPVEPVVVPEPELWGSILDVVAPVAPVAVKVWGSELDAPAVPAPRKSTLQVFSGSGKMSKAPAKAPVVQAQARFQAGDFQISPAMGAEMLARYEDGETQSALVIAFKVPGDPKNAGKKVWNAIDKARKAQA